MIRNNVVRFLITHCVTVACNMGVLLLFVNFSHDLWNHNASHCAVASYPPGPVKPSEMMDQYLLTYLLTLMPGPSCAWVKRARTSIAACGGAALKAAWRRGHDTSTIHLVTLAPARKTVSKYVSLCSITFRLRLCVLSTNI